MGKNEHFEAEIDGFQATHLKYSSVHYFEIEMTGKPSSMNNPKKYRKITEGERLEISSRKLGKSKEHTMQRWA